MRTFSLKTKNMKKQTNNNNNNMSASGAAAAATAAAGGAGAGAGAAAGAVGASGVDAATLKQLGLNEEQAEEFREAFNLFDKDQDGVITTHELGTVVRSFGLNPSGAEMAEMLAEVDPDGNGNVQFMDFLKMVAKRLKDTEAEAEIVEAFQVFDAENKGVVDAGDLKHVCKELGEMLTEEEIDEMIKEADTKNDGKINYRQFVKFMMAST